MKESISNIISSFRPINLFEMDVVALLKRVDTKFLLRADQLPALLQKMQSEYNVLEINNKRILSYKSLYFDTPEYKFYNEHHNGKIKRIKVRIRKYIDSNLYFLEVKKKDGKGNTNKSRVKIDSFEEALSSDSKRFISGVIDQELDLQPSLWNSFERMTLVNTIAKERVTIDMNLQFMMKDQLTKVDNIVIIELKQERFNQKSTIVRELRKLGVHQYGFSKYCIGMISTFKNLKYNRFKPKLLRIKKITA
ncbi:polyphosphate polymerase domain-containing protein [Saprospiraceae bacterium]|nr:polyphosphate polymerase domain-containing protein [Saprospiraceae bacterium]